MTKVQRVTLAMMLTVGATACGGIVEHPTDGVVAPLPVTVSAPADSPAPPVSPTACACQTGFHCATDATECDPNPDGLWTIRAVSAEVTAPVYGASGLVVCVTVGMDGARTCTPVSEGVAAAWKFDFPAVMYSAIRHRTAVELLTSDGVLLCTSESLDIDRHFFMEGSFLFWCSTAQVEFSLTPAKP